MQGCVCEDIHSLALYFPGHFRFRSVSAIPSQFCRPFCPPPASSASASASVDWVNMARMNRPAPVEITYKNMRFLITHNPTNATLNKFIEVSCGDGGCMISLAYATASTINKAIVWPSKPYSTFRIPPKIGKQPISSIYNGSMGVCLGNNTPIQLTGE